MTNTNGSAYGGPNANTTIQQVYQMGLRITQNICGIVSAPMINNHEAALIAGTVAGINRTVKKNMRFRAASPNNEIWPRRYIRRLKLE